MSSAQDRREHERVPVRLVVHFSQGDKPYRLVSENLSLGGIFLKGADEVCEEGDRLLLAIVVPGEAGESEQHDVRGVVAQKIRGAGAGISFDWSGKSARAREALERFIKRAGMLTDGAIHSEHVGLASDAEEER